MLFCCSAVAGSTLRYGSSYTRPESPPPTRTLPVPRAWPLLGEVATTRTTDPADFGFVTPGPRPRAEQQPAPRAAAAGPRTKSADYRSVYLLASQVAGWRRFGPPPLMRSLHTGLCSTGRGAPDPGTQGPAGRSADPVAAG